MYVNEYEAAIIAHYKREKIESQIFSIRKEIQQHTKKHPHRVFTLSSVRQLVKRRSR